MTSPEGSRKEAFPTGAVLVLAAATLLMVAAEMLPMALLAPMSRGLGVAEAQVGVLVSVWAAVVLIASLPLSRLARRWRARTVIVTAIAVLAVSSLATAVAPTYPVALLARIGGAAAVALLWATINAFVADIVPDRLLGRAVAIVLGGGTFGMVLGIPLGRLLADAADWRVAFAALGGALAVIAFVVRAIVPSVPRRHSDAGARTSAGSARELGIVTALVAVALIGHYGAYTFITTLTAPAATLLPGGVATTLLVFGVASAGGVVVAARAGTRTGAALVAAMLATAASLAALGWSAPLVSVAVVVAWGLASGAFPPLAQTLILRIAGPKRRDDAAAFIPMLFNAGIAVGAGAASGVVALGGAEWLPPAAAVVVAGAAALLATMLRVRSRHQEEVAGRDARVR